MMKRTTQTEEGMTMRPKLRWIPKDSEAINHPQGLGVCYVAAFGNGGFQVVAYGGKRNSHDGNYSFKTREQVDKYIKQHFDGLTAHQDYKAKQRQEESERQPDPCNPTLAETAQLIRELLVEAFPRTKFSVRSESYSMGCSIRVHWTDGPTFSQVHPIIDSFERCGFDGMQDLKTYNGPSIYKGHVVHFGADYVQGSRDISSDLMKKAAFVVAFECDLPLLKLGDDGCFEGGDYRVDWRRYKQGDDEGFCQDDRQGEQYSQLIYQTARATSCEAQQPVDLPKLKEKREN